MSFWRHVATVVALVAVGLAPVALGPEPGHARTTSTPVASPIAGSPVWWDDAVCYEVFVRSFFDSDGDGTGDLNGLTAKLDYLNDGDPATSDDLGVTCLWLMPVFESPSYHGYDVTDYEAIEPDYGTMEDFTAFLAEAHRRGMRVILDLPLNHTSSEHPWFVDALRNPASPYRDWYIWSDTDPGYPGPWGETVWHRSPVREEYYYGVFSEGMPDLNYRNPAVTLAALETSRFWLSKGVDGFRLDAIKHLVEDGKLQENTPETHRWLQDYGLFLSAEFPNVLTVGEIFGAGASILEPYFEPEQLDAYFQFEIAGQLLNAADSGNGGSLVYTMEDALAKRPTQPFATFLTNHDQVRSMTVLAGDVAEAKLAATALLTLPGLPFIYYGEEIGMRGEEPDERLRTPMQWGGGPNGGFTTGGAWEALQGDQASINVASQEGDPLSLLNLYRRLIQLHVAHPALGFGDFVPIESSARSVTAYLRTAGEDIVMVVLNFGDERAERPAFSLAPGTLPSGTYRSETLLGGVPLSSVSVGEDGALTVGTGVISIPANATWVYALRLTS
jgi:alpha-amylase